MSAARAKRQLRIGVDLRALVAEPTGIGFFTIAVLRELAQIERLELVGMAHAEPNFRRELDELGIALEIDKAPLGIIWQQLLVPRRLRRGDLDAFWSPLLTLPRRPPVPSLVNIHDLTPLLYPGTHRLKVRLSLLPFLRTSIRDASRVVTGSESAARDLRNHFPQSRGKIEVIPNGVSDDFKPAAEVEVEATRQRLGLPQGYILFIGTLEPRKDVGTLLDAWESLADRDRQLPLVLIGPYGWRNRSLLQRIESLQPSGVRYLGRVSRAELVSTLQAARVFAYPSLYEGFGLPVAEAMACGVPTIASDTSSLPEVVGKGGLLVSPGSPSELAEALSRLIGDPIEAAELGRRGLLQSRRFRWHKTARRIAELFERIVAEATPNASSPSRD